MNVKLPTKKLIALLIAINVFHLAMWIYIAAQKIDFYEDEWFNFLESNNHQIESYGLTEGQIYTMDIAETLFAVDRSHRFDFSVPYGNVVYMGSSHPPLGRMLAHFANSFVPGVFSNWPGFILNFVALTLTAYSVFFTTREIWRDDMAALFVMAVFGTMYGVLNMAVYLYSYCILMMWAGWLVFWHLREKKNHGLLVLLAVLGGLTHYYFFVLLAMTALYYGIGLLVKKRWGEVWLYIGSMAIAAGLYLLIYPHVITQLTNEYDRAGQALKQLQGTNASPGISIFLSELCESVFRETRALILSILVILAAFVWFYVKHRTIPRETANRLLLVAVPASLFLLAIAKIAPIISDRFIAVIFPSAGIVFWGLLYQAMKQFLQKWGGGVLVAALLFVLLFFGFRRLVFLPYNCFQVQQPQHDMYAAYLPENNNVAVLHVHGGGSYFSIYYHALKKAKYLQRVYYENPGLFSDFPEDGDIILLVSPGVFDSEIGENVVAYWRELSGKSEATYLGQTWEHNEKRHGEAWLLE